MDGLRAWAQQPNPSASNSQHARTAGVRRWFPIPKLCTSGKCPSNWTSPLLLPRVSNWSQPAPASLCSRSVPCAARIRHLASKHSTSLEASVFFPSYTNCCTGSQTLLHPSFLLQPSGPSFKRKKICLCQQGGPELRRQICFSSGHSRSKW